MKVCENCNGCGEIPMQDGDGKEHGAFCCSECGGTGTVSTKNELCNEIAMLKKDVEFLLPRARLCGSFVSSLTRDYGASSNSLVAIAYGAGIAELILPGDKHDLAACERAYDKLPDHRKECAAYALALARAKIAQ